MFEPIPKRNGTLCTALLGAALIAIACGGGQPAPAALAAEAAPVSYSGVPRADFNLAAVFLNLPLYWIWDANNDAVVDPAEVAALDFYPEAMRWVDEKGAFTPELTAAFARIRELASAGSPVPAGLAPDEAERLRLVADDLAQGRPTLVASDLSGLGEEEKEVARLLLAAAREVDELHAVQNGSAALAARVSSGDLLSRSLFRRNLGPRCAAPRTEPDPKCSAVPGAPKQLVDAYPAALQAEPDFCAKLQAEPNGKDLAAPFTVVRDEGGKLVARGLHEAYRDRMEAVAHDLEAAAAAVADPKEQALKTYLLAAAGGFRTNIWTAADEAWSRMNAENSKWYLRAAPDEVDWDPCSFKAGFHLTLARIDPDSITWQQKLAPVQQDMENALAALIGKPYKANKVTFHLPDFIRIVANAGNDRMPLGGVLGESLPNWGPVANEGRGRTVVMTNLYTDPDSLAVLRSQAESLLTTETMQSFTASPEPGLLSVILHEAAHNLGPSHEYKHKGKTDTEAFGGPLAATLEELKAQTASLWFHAFLIRRGAIDDTMSRQAWVNDLIWACGHISRGMYTAEGKPKPYSQLAAIELGFLMRQGALVFDPEAPAANGKDKGAFTIRFDKMQAALDELMRLAGRIKAANDEKAAKKLVADFVDSQAVPQALIAERMLRETKASFVYSIAL